ncbi:hypothetical protein [Helicobacter pylori]|uniref:hypothetical protein n=1 Tax=Helicobacter pylori TaxID=210 RepID=UPI0002BACBD5|nr:hypothetical protein [Helicobacter pylori]EMH20160.1 hypothetical protein HMPREF1415_00354 [Helicobacter pylori GAM254Ai]
MYADVRNHKIPFDRNDLKSHLGSLYSNDGFIERSVTKKLTDLCQSELKALLTDTIQASETILKSVLALKNGKSQAQTKGLATLKKTRETEFLIPYCQNFLVNVFFARYWFYGCFSI